MNETKTKMEQLFQVLDETTEILQKELSLPFLEALAETGENIFQGEILQELDDLSKRRLKKSYETISLKEIDREQTRKAFQLAILKGMKEATQVNHEMTPDAVSLFIGYLIERLTGEKESVSLLDPAIGTANLVTAVLNQMTKTVIAYGIEVDDTLISLSYVNANLQKHHIELFKQDSLEPALIDPVDVIVSDLPVGYYPNDIIAKDYELKAETGHSYAHYLFIEKSIERAKDGGFLLFLVPNFIFEEEEASRLHTYIKNHAHIQGLLQLPSSLFKKGTYAKSIFILRKKGENIEPPTQALLAQLPSFSNKDAMQGIVQRINHWIETEIKS